MNEMPRYIATAGHELRGPHQSIGDTTCGGGTTAFLQLVVLPDGRTVEVTKPIVLVGRHSDADLRLAYPEVSRRHCRLVFKNGVWHVHDLGSLNGMFVNGMRMFEATLTEGDRICIGDATLVVTSAPAPARAASTGMLQSITEALR